MARKTQDVHDPAGFFDLAIAAPSMKAWGSKSNLFQHGVAKVTDVPTSWLPMAKPGVILRRPLGTKAAFREHVELPSNFGIGACSRSAEAAQPKGKRPSKPLDDKTDAAGRASV